MIRARKTSQPFGNPFAMFTEWAGEAGSAYDVLSERFPPASTLDSAIAQGVADADAGRTSSAADVFDRLKAKYEAMPNAETAAAMIEAEAMLAARRATI